MQRLRTQIPIMFLIPVLAGACTSTSSVRSMQETLRTDYAPLEEEQWAIDQADLYHREFVQQGLLYGDAQVTACMNRIEIKLLSEQEELQGVISLFMLKSPAPNAFALPNGNVYLNAGLLTTLETEDQLAAIAAHEIAHVTQRHSVKAIISQKNKLIGSHIADFATGGVGLVYFGTMASIMNFSREQEKEADEVGLVYLVDSGYQPQAMLEAFQSMSRYPELEHAKQSIYSSHPSVSSRMTWLERLVGAESIEPVDAPVRDEGFEAFKARMMEDSLLVRLRNEEFNRALTIVDEAGGFFSATAKAHFYRGEIHFGYYIHPEKSAREYYWIQTGKDKGDEDTEEKFKQDQAANLAAAIEHYESAIRADPPHAKAYRRLGEIAELRGEDQQALTYFDHYLVLSPDARDRLYVERALERLGKKTGDTP